MSPKRIIIAGTMALSISICSLLQGDKSGAEASTRMNAPSETNSAVTDDLRAALGVESDEDIYDALYEGQTLAELAERNGKDAETVVDLQVAQLAEQLSLRLASGCLSPERYEAHLAELREIVARSVYGEAT